MGRGSAGMGGSLRVWNNTDYQHNSQMEFLELEIQMQL
jgi:hypothetical protein